MIFVFINLQKISNGAYRVQLFINSIENRGGRCADQDACSSGEGCCESSICAITTCQYILELCQKSPALDSSERSIDDVCTGGKNSGPPLEFERSNNNFVAKSPITLAGPKLVSYCFIVFQ